MGVKEKLSGAIERIKAPFAISTSNLDQFVKTVEAEGCTRVKAQCFTDLGNYSSSDFTLSMYFEAHNQDLLLFTSKTGKGRTVVLQEDYGRILGSPRFSTQDKEVQLLKLLLTANARLGEVGRKVPNVETYVEGSGGIRMTTQDMNVVFELAHNLAPYPKPDKKPSYIFR